MTIKNVADLGMAIIQFWSTVRAFLPDEKSEQLLAIAGKSEKAEQAANLIGFAYHNKALLPADAREVAADICEVVTLRWGIYGLGQNLEGLKIAQSLRGHDAAEPPRAALLKALWQEPVASPPPATTTIDGEVN